MLDDIELSRLPPESLLLKAMRLARITEHEKMGKYLGFELYGFPAINEDVETWGTWVGRFTDYVKKLGYWEPLSVIYAKLLSAQEQLQALRIPDLSYAPHSSNRYEYVVGGLLNPVASGITSVISQQQTAKEEITKFSGIKSRVLAVLHTWISGVYYERLFSEQQAALFDNIRTGVDAKLADRCADALQKIPSVIERLSAGDQEAISHALTSCRRMMDSFCDAIQPPSNETFEFEGKQHKLTADLTKNRFTFYLASHCVSPSRRHRLRDTMINLYDRASTGIHAEVSPEEARFLFFEVYLWIGEVLSLPDLPPAPAPDRI